MPLKAGHRCMGQPQHRLVPIDLVPLPSIKPLMYCTEWQGVSLVGYIK